MFLSADREGELRHGPAQHLPPKVAKRDKGGGGGAALTVQDVRWVMHHSPYLGCVCNMEKLDLCNKNSRENSYAYQSVFGLLRWLVW